MADTTTELEVLDEIVDVLGGQSGQYETVVPVLQQIYTLLEAGITDPEAIAAAVAAWLDEHPEATTTVQDGSITGPKIADDTIPDAKLAQTGGIYSAVYNVQPIELPQEYAQPQTLKVELSDDGKLWHGTHNVAELLGIKEGTFNINGVTFTVSGTTISISGTATENFNYSLVDGATKTSTELVAMTLPLPNGKLFTFSAKALNTTTVHPAFMSRGKVSGNVFACQNNAVQFTMDTSTCGGLYTYIQSGKVYDVTYNLALLPFAATNTNPYRDESSDIAEIDESGTHEVSGYVWGIGATVALVASRIEQATRRCRAIYSQRSIPYTGATEVLDVFIPCRGGYAHVLLGHTVNQESNADSWRIIQFKAANDQMADLFNITQFGETEMAIKINGRNDFIGGYTHGDEVIVSGSLVFVMDGAPIDVSALTDYTEFDNLKIVEVTNLYDPNDSTTVVGKHGREYVITKDGIDLLQTVIWDGSYTLDGSYMPMVCAIRGNDSTSATQITDTYFDDGSFELYDVSSPNFGGYPKSNKTDVSRMVLYSDVSNVCITTDIVSQTELTGRASFLYDGDAYNKIYNGVCGVTAQHTTQAGEKWQTRAHLKFEIG